MEGDNKGRTRVILKKIQREMEREVNGPGRRAKDKASKGMKSWLHLHLLSSLMFSLWICLQYRHRLHFIPHLDTSAGVPTVKPCVITASL